MPYIKFILYVSLSAMCHTVVAQSQLVKDLIPGQEGITDCHWTATGANGVVFSAGYWNIACNLGVTDGTQEGTDWIGCEPYFNNTGLVGTIGGQVIFFTRERHEQPYTVWTSDGSTAKPTVLWQEPINGRNYLRLPDASQLVGGKACGIIHDNRNDLTVISTDGTPGETKVLATLPAVFGNVWPFTLALEDQWLLTLKRRVADQETVTRYLADPTLDALTLLEQEIVPHRTDLHQWLIGNRIYELYHILPSISGVALSWVNWRSQDSLSDIHRIDLTGKRAGIKSYHFPTA